MLFLLLFILIDMGISHSMPAVELGAAVKSKSKHHHHHHQGGGFEAKRNLPSSVSDFIQWNHHNRNSRIYNKGNDYLEKRVVMDVVNRGTMSAATGTIEKEKEEDILDSAPTTSSSSLWPPWPFSLLTSNNHESDNASIAERRSGKSTALLFGKYLRQKSIIGLRQMQQGKTQDTGHMDNSKFIHKIHTDIHVYYIVP